jgi:hemolysin III
MLVSLAPTKTGSVAAGVYCISLTTLFGISAIYHRPTWGTEARQIMRRLDHSAIFLLIAGTYTPFILLAFPEPPSRQSKFLLWIWTGAGVGILQSVFWPKAPKTFVALLCLALGWAGVLEWQTFQTALDKNQIALTALGGLFYSVGAVIYAMKQPDPWPRVFGYHEIFHALTILATGCHFSVVYHLVVVSNDEE